MLARLRIQEFKRLRTSHDLSILGLSQLSGVPKSTIDKVSQDRRDERIIRYSTICKFATAFRVDPASLTNGEPWKPEVQIPAMIYKPTEIIWDPMVVRRAMKFRGVTVEQLAEHLGMENGQTEKQLNRVNHRGGTFIQRVNAFLGLSNDHVIVQYPEGSRQVRDWKNRLYLSVEDMYTANGLTFHAGFPLSEEGYPVQTGNMIPAWIFPEELTSWILKNWKTNRPDDEAIVDFLNLSQQACRKLLFDLDIIQKTVQPTARILELETQGHDPATIAEITRCSTRLVRDTLMRHGRLAARPHKWWMQREDIMDVALNPGITNEAFAILTGYTEDGATRLRKKIRRFYNHGTSRTEVAQQKRARERAARGLASHDEYARDVDGQTYILTERRKGDPDILKGRKYPLNKDNLSVYVVLTDELALFFRLAQGKSIKEMGEHLGITYTGIRPLLERLGLAPVRKTRRTPEYTWPPNRELIQDIDDITFAVTRKETTGPVPLHFGYPEHARGAGLILDAVFANWMREHSHLYIGKLAPSAAEFKMSYSAWTRCRQRLGLTNQGKHHYFTTTEAAKETIQEQPWFVVDGIPDRIVSKAIPIARRIEQDGLSKDKLNKNERLYRDYSGLGHKLISIKLNRAYRLIVGHDDNGRYKTYGIMHHDDYEQRNAMITFIKRAQS